MRYLMAHDLGTSGDKATLFDEEGKLIGSSIKEYAVHYFNENWAEQNADDWWNAVCDTTKSLMKRWKVKAEEIAVVSFSGQMMGCLCVDRRGIPLRPSIIWADMRAEEEARIIENSISQWEFYNIVGHRNTASYGIQKLMWIKRNEPEVYANTYKMLNAKDYIVLKLTGNFYTDYSDANSCGCFDLVHMCWSEKILKAADISMDKLPECKPSTFIGGRVTEEAAALTGLHAGTTVVLGAGDGVTANVGSGSIREGKTYCCLGTSAWITTTSATPIFDEKMRIVNWAHAVPGYYAPNGTMQAAGASYSWAKNQICLWEQMKAKECNGSPYQYMNASVAKSIPGANGIYFLPYLLGERAPRWNSNAKGAFIGLKAENTRSDLLRSVLEGVTMNLDICLKVLQSHLQIDEITVVGGGARGAVWRQIMADIFGTRILVPQALEEGGSMGAAVIGGVGAGIFKDFSVVDELFLKMEHMQIPNPLNTEIYQKKKLVFEQLYQALEPLYQTML